MHYLLQPAVGWTVAEPKGVALIISPWNYPVLLSFEPMADAIAAGNCVCMKPSELSPHTSGVMADLIARYMDRRRSSWFREAAGDDKAAGAAVQSHLLHRRRKSRFDSHGRRREASHTGHFGARRQVAGVRRPYREPRRRRAAHRWGRFINAGQTCVAPDYVLATSDVIEPLAGKIAEAVTRFFGSDLQHSDSFGRIITPGISTG